MSAFLLTSTSRPPEKQREHDYEDIQDDSSVSVSMEVTQVSVEQEGEAGRISVEVNRPLNFRRKPRLPVEKAQSGLFSAQVLVRLIIWCVEKV